MTNPATALGGVARGSWPGARWRFRALALCAFAAAMLVVCAQAAAQVVASYSMSFVPSTIAPGGTSKLVLTVDPGSNPIGSLSVSSGQLAGSLMVVPNSGTTTCPDPQPFAYGPTSFAFDTGQKVLLQSTTCTISVEVTASVPGTIVQPAFFFTYFACEVFPEESGPPSIVCDASPSQLPGTGASLAVLAGAPPVITSPPPGGGIVGQPYSHQVTVTGTAPVTVTASGLPPGLKFDPTTLQVTGAPTSGGTFTGTFTATNGFRPDAIQNFSITIGVPPTITSPPPGPGTVGVPYSHQVTVTGTSPVTIAVSPLPPGLGFNPSTLQITGTPTTTGDFTGTITASNAYRPPASQNFDIAIGRTLPALAITTASPLPATIVNTPYSLAFAATGGSPPYSWTQGAGTLPPGLALGGNGVLSGTPTTAGTFTFDVRVTDGASAATTKSSVTKTFALSVNPPTASPLVIITDNPLAPAALPVGSPFNVSLVAAGGIPPYRWGAVSGALPPGLTLDANGNIGGSPNRAGSYSFTAQVLDAANNGASRAYSLDVVVPIAPLVITTPSPLSPPIATGGSIAVDLQAQGGVPPYSWQVSGGALPPGVALAPNGHLSGTATQAGTFDFEVTVTDSPGSTARRSYSLIVTTLTPTLRVDVTPNPDTFTIPVTITVTVGGAATTATGAVHLWVAGTGTRCPTPFAGGNPGDPLAIARNATLASGRAQFTVPNLPVDDYLVCVRYDGDSVYASADNGPQTLNVIKGVLLAPPTVTLAAPAQVPPRSIVVAQVSVAPVGTTQMPQGTVSLRGIPGSAAVATLTNGAAEVAFIAPATGSVALTVDYAGDGAFPAASSPAVSIAVAADTAIPALSPPALGMLALLLGGLAVHALRRRRR